MSRGVFEDNNSGSNLSELSKVVNVEVDLSAVNEENKCFNEDENWDMIIAELNTQHESDQEESKNEDFKGDTEPIDLKDMLSNITRHASEANKLATKKSVNLFAEVEKEY